MTSAEIELKGTKEDAIVENAEIVFYDILIQLVHKTNVEGEVVSVLCRSYGRMDNVQYTSHAYSAMVRY